MTQEVTVTQQSLRIMQSFSNADLALIRATICKGATEPEFKLFINQSRTLGLNPLARQIFAVKRWDSSQHRETMMIQVSIDGFRLVAERTGKYAGQVGPFWCGEDGVWKDVWLSDRHPIAAKVGALRNDFQEPCWGIARFNAYAQRKKEGGLTSMWEKMGDVMIAKCAESLALRKAFPQELSGVYTNDEMAHVADDAADGRQTQSVLITHSTQEAKPATDNVTKLAEAAKAFAKEVGLCTTKDALDKLLSRSTETIECLKTSLPKWHDKLSSLISKQYETIAQEEAVKAAVTVEVDHDEVI